MGHGVSPPGSRVAPVSVAAGWPRGGDFSACGETRSVHPCIAWMTGCGKSGLSGADAAVRAGPGDACQFDGGQRRAEGGQRRLVADPAGVAEVDGHQADAVVLAGGVVAGAEVLRAPPRPRGRRRGLPPEDVLDVLGLIPVADVLRDQDQGLGPQAASRCRRSRHTAAPSYEQRGRQWRRRRERVPGCRSPPYPGVEVAQRC